jgi:hypothetical protein
MTKCTQCGRALTLGDTVDAERLEQHRLWRHPEPADRAVLWHEIEAMSTQIRFAVDHQDWVGAYLVLGDLIDHAYRAQTYCNQLIEEHT